MYSAVQDRLDLDEESLKLILGINETGEPIDTLVSLALTSAKEQADLYMQNKFLLQEFPIEQDYIKGVHSGYATSIPGSQTGMEQPIPATVKIGVIAFAGEILRSLGVGEGASSPLSPALKSMKADGMSLTFALPSDIVSEGGGLQGVYSSIAKTYWSKYRMFF